MTKLIKFEKFSFLYDYDNKCKNIIVKKVSVSMVVNNAGCAQGLEGFKPSIITM